VPSLLSPTSRCLGAGALPRRYVAPLALLLVVGGCSGSRRAPSPAAPPRSEPPSPLLAVRQSPFGTVYVLRQGTRRVLRFGGPHAEDQSIIEPRAPRREPMEYIRTALLALAYTEGRRRLLMIGVGGGSFMRHVAYLAPQIDQEGVEINPVVLKLARRFFQLPPAGPRMRFHVADGRRFVRAATRRFDIVFVDAYDAVDYPRHLGTQEFFRQVRRALAPGGVCVANLSPNTHRMRDDLVLTFNSVFRAAHCYYIPEANNTVVFGWRAPVEARGAAELRAAVAALERRTGGRYGLARAATQRCRFSLQRARLLRDKR